MAVAGLMGCIVACLDVKTTLLGKSHYLLYSLATAIQVGLLIRFSPLILQQYLMFGNLYTYPVSKRDLCSELYSLYFILFYL